MLEQSNRLPYLHIIWDWNGTLLDDSWLCVEVMDGILRQRGLPGLSPERYADLFDFPVVSYYKRLGFDLEQEPFERLSDAFISTYRTRIEECTLRPGTRRAIDFASRKGLSQSILSAMEQAQLEHLLARFDLRSSFTDVLGLDDHHARGKLEIGQRWMAAQKLDPRMILLVGDTLHDAEVAASLGVDCALIYSGHQSKERLAAPGRILLNSLDELFAIESGESQMQDDVPNGENTAPDSVGGPANR